MKDIDVFLIVKDHLLTQKKRATVGSNCAYKAKDGSKCAIGCLIKDELYDPGIEGEGLKELVLSLVTKSLPTWENDLTSDSSDSLRLLTDLQDLHDMGDPYDWERHLKSFDFWPSGKYNAIFDPEDDKNTDQ